MIRKSLIAIISTLSLAIPAVTHAAIPSLNIAPLKYEQQLELGKNQQGFVDVANPSDVTVTVTSKVQAFRQIDSDGRLEYYDNERLAAAVKVDLSSFELGPREAVRVAFTIDPAKLGEGGAYGVIFFRTEPKQGSGDGVQVQTSAQVGSLLILSVGSGGTRSGSVSRVASPIAVFAKTLKLGYSFHNTGSGPQALAFNPNLQVKVGWLGKWQSSTSGLVSPGLTRNFSQSVASNHFGLFPVSVRDTVTKSQRTSWTFGAVGTLGLLGFLALAIILVAVAYIMWRKKKR